jgi:hypothetical protein
MGLFESTVKETKEAAEFFSSRKGHSELCLFNSHSSTLSFPHTESPFSSFPYHLPAIHPTTTTTMEDTQSFRLVEATDTTEITLHHIGGQNIVYWEDIERVFPGVKRVQSGNSVIRFLRGSDHQRYLKKHNNESRRTFLSSKHLINIFLLSES